MQLKVPLMIDAKLVSKFIQRLILCQGQIASFRTPISINSDNFKTSKTLSVASLPSGPTSNSLKHQFFARKWKIGWWCYQSLQFK